MNKYDKQIAYLTENPDRIGINWRMGKDLFRYLGNDVGRKVSGCLTMIRDDPNGYSAIINGKVDEELTQKIAQDERIPKNPDDITVSHLPVFKEYQELVDKLDPNRE